MFNLRKATLVALVTATLAWSSDGLMAQANAGAMAQQQQMQQLQQRLHQNAQALGQSIQQMQQIQQRAQQLQQNCTSDMQQLQQKQNLQLHEQQQLRTHQQVADMANSVSGAAQEMVKAMERLRLMAQDPNGNWNGEAAGEMLRLQERLHQVTGELEEGLQIMERLRQRVNQGS